MDEKSRKKEERKILFLNEKNENKKNVGGRCERAGRGGVEG
jgi:hypothetical protein